MRACGKQVKALRDIENARTCCKKYISCYNTIYHHTALGGFTAEQVFTWEFESIGKIKQQSLDTQYLLHPARFVKAPTKVAMPEEHVYINPIISENREIEQKTGVNLPTLKRAKQV